MNMTLSRGDLRSAAESIISLWNDCLGDSYPVDDRLFLQLALMGEKDEKALFLSRREEDGLVSGAVLAKIAKDEDSSCARPVGYLSFLLVAPREQGQGLGGRLLGEAERWCREKGAVAIHLGSDYGHFFPGVPLYDSPIAESALAFFSNRKYAAGTVEMDLISDLSNNSLFSPGAEDTERLKAAGVRFASCAPSRRAAVSGFFAHSFPGRWEREISEAFSKGLRDEDLALLIRKEDEAVIGFARLCCAASPLLSPGLYWRALLGPNAAALGPIGIDPAYRGGGLGLSLLRLALESLKARGARNTIIDWTDLDRFYAKVGFVPWKRYLGMTRTLEA